MKKPRDMKPIEALTPVDVHILRQCIQFFPQPTEHIHLGGIISHFRFFRLVEAGIALTIPPRLRPEAIEAFKAFEAKGAHATR